jgi:ATP-dependent DNA helicase RecQ
MAGPEIDLQAALQRYFGLDAFRPGQEQVIRELLGGRDVLTVMPTGAGKSLVYQLAAQLLPGVTIVVSPLLALMRDQVEALEARGLEVGVINSALTQREARAELQQVLDGDAKLLYVTPERFGNTSFMRQLRDVEISLFCVDEAHCISDWGHSFRPAYLKLGEAIKRLKRPTLLALTATATPWIRNEIVERLAMREPVLVVREMDRPNLMFEVTRVESEEYDRQVLKSLLQEPATQYPDDIRAKLTTAMQGSGIVYTATTEAARETAGWLREWGIAADYYHGQRRKVDRARVQDAFMSGELRVVVATNAFGLGVDKADVRWVIHRDIPASLEAYYQEAGRAGRDGKFARCVIIYRPEDLGRASFLAASGQLTRDEVVRARAGLVAHGEMAIGDLPAITGLNKSDLARLLRVLKRQRIVREARGRLRLLQPDFDPTAISLAEEEQRVAYERSRLDMMRAYAEAADCRRCHLLPYFGDTPEADRCNLCDNDLSSATAAWISVARAETDSDLFPAGTRVAHASWGEGVVQRIAGGDITVLFDNVGFKTLAASLVAEQALLRAL